MLSAMAKDEYYYAGMSVAMSIIHSGPSPSFLSPVLYDAICSEHPESVAVTPDEVYDPHWRGVLFEVIIKHIGSLKNHNCH